MLYLPFGVIRPFPVIPFSAYNLMLFSVTAITEKVE